MKSYHEWWGGEGEGWVRSGAVESGELCKDGASEWNTEFECWSSKYLSGQELL